MIRNALPSDSESIRNIIAELTIDRTADSSKSGFLEYPLPDNRTLRERIRSTPFFYVSEQDRNINGFLATYPDNFLSHFSFSGDEIAQHILTTREKPFLYLELLGIRPPFQRRGLGPIFIRRLRADSRISGYRDGFGAIAKAPYHNRRSHQLVLGMGFSTEEDIETSKGLTFTIYHCSI